MKSRLFALTLVLIFTAIACRFIMGDSASPGEPPPSEAQPQAEPSHELRQVMEAPLDPINVAPSLDEGAEVTAVIPPEGGSLSAAGTDGSRYTLEIPPGALVEPTSVSMMPLTAVSGLPFSGGFAAGVRLLPEGLALDEFAILSITPAQPLPVQEQLFFGYEGGGQGLFLVPPVVDSPEIKLQVLHFSGYGVSKGLLADIEPVRRRLGGSEEARLSSLIGEILAAERQRQLLGVPDAEPNTNAIEQINALVEEYMQKVLRPRLAAAGESCAAGRLAMQTLFQLERQRQLMGVSDENTSLMDEFPGLIEKVARVCLKEEYELCRDQHIIHRMIPVWLSLERQLQLLGISGSSLSEEALNYAQQCLTFELEFDSLGMFDAGDGGGYNSSVRSKVKLRFTGGIGGAITGQAPLVNESFEFTVPGCSTTSNRGGSTFETTQLMYEVAKDGPGDQLGHIKDFKMIYFPGITGESFTIKCDDSSYSSPPTALWTGLFIVAHRDELNPSDQGQPGGQGVDPGSLVPGQGGPMAYPSLPPGSPSPGFVATGWTINGGELFATLEWEKQDAGLGILESGTFKLYHRPGG